MKSISDPLSMPQFKEVVLQRIRFRSDYLICNALVESCEFREIEVQHGMEMILAMNAAILSDPEQVISVEWPKDWWQHFKQRWFPKCALKKWPVVMRKKELCARVVYPNLVTPKQEHQHRVMMEVR